MEKADREVKKVCSETTIKSTVTENDGRFIEHVSKISTVFEDFHFRINIFWQTYLLEWEGDGKQIIFRLRFWKRTPVGRKWKYDAKMDLFLQC